MPIKRRCRRMFLARRKAIHDPFHCCVPHVAVGYLWLKPITHDKLVFIPRITFDCAAARTSNSIRSMRENSICLLLSLVRYLRLVSDFLWLTRWPRSQAHSNWRKCSSPDAAGFHLQPTPGATGRTSNSNSAKNRPTSKFDEPRDIFAT